MLVISGLKLSVPQKFLSGTKFISREVKCKTGSLIQLFLTREIFRSSLCRWLQRFWKQIFVQKSHLSEALYYV